MREKVKLADLASALEKSWSLWTTADKLNWTERNRAWGQCAVTALVVQDFLGGSLLRVDLSKNPDPAISAIKSHYLNLVNGDEIDLSKSQFDAISTYGWVRIIAPKPEERTREYLLSNEDTKARYRTLRLQVSQILSGYENNPFFEDPVLINCLLTALSSDCQKGKYGCIVTHPSLELIATTNRVAEPLKDWSEPVCIRIRNNIPSRTESMVGCCSHAEEEALKQIRENGWNPKDCKLYVAGYRSNGLIYIKPEPVFSCLRCAVQLYMHGIGEIYVPCREGWAKMTAEEAVKTAKKFALKEKVLENY